MCQHFSFTGGGRYKVESVHFIKQEKTLTFCMLGGQIPSMEVSEGFYMD
jgi:hypothetical protein